MAALRVGVDVGGTFTDLVAWDGETGEMRACKVPTVPADPAEGVVAGLAALVRDQACTSIAHGTTIVTNAIVERRGAPTALVTTRGFRDVLEIARMNRAHLYRLDLPPKSEPLVPRHLRVEVTERIGPDGAVQVPLDVAELAPIVRALAQDGITTVAVCLLHAYANPVHERAIRLALEPHFRYVSCSSDVNAEFREYERTCTTVLNAAVMPAAAQYLDRLAAVIADRAGTPALHLLHSAGGMMSVAAAKARPLAMAMSGPAAGVAAAAHVARTLGIARALAFDMGGTTTDVCLIADGAAETTSERRLADYPVRLPMVAVESIGAGGGSIARVDAVGALKVGPRSAGAVPGPVCYGQGGEEPTVTDANLVLGYLDPERVYGGSIKLDPERAHRVLAELGERLGLSAIAAARGVVEIANANMLRALRLVSVQRGYDLREFALIAYGGAGPLHAGALARECGIARLVVPAHSGAFSALGCLVSPLRYDAVLTYRARLDQWDAKVAADRFGELEAQCLRPILDEGHDIARVLVDRSTDLRYSGQNYEIAVRHHPDPAELRRVFEARHRQLYGYATGESVESVNLRVTARIAPAAAGGRAGSSDDAPRATVSTGSAHGARRAAAIRRRRAHFPEGEMDVARHDRGGIAPGLAISGPAVVEDEWSTIVVYPGQRATADGAGNLLVEVMP